MLTNWRGVVAPGNIDDGQKDALLDVVDELHSSDEWQAALEENAWTDAYITDEEFGTYIEDQTGEATTTLQQIGLIG